MSKKFAQKVRVKYNIRHFLRQFKFVYYIVGKQVGNKNIIFFFRRHL